MSDPQPAFTDPVWIPLADLLAQVGHYEPCPDCAGGLGIIAGPGPQEWEIARGHDLTCPTLSRNRRPPLTVVRDDGPHETEGR